MASSAVQGFLTGFATTLSEDIMSRKKEARDYFNKQVEYARTTGMENRRRVQETVNSNLSVARQLEAYGIPKEVIMAQISQNPAGLASFYEQAEKIRASKQRDLTPEEWKSIYSVYGQLSSPDEDLSTFISRTYDPIANATSSPDFEDDPEGSLMASLMGFNAMDKARAKLGQTPIAEGLTAEQLVAYGDDTVARPTAGSAGVKVNYDALAEEDPLSISESKAVNEAIDTAVKDAINFAAISPGATVSREFVDKLVVKMMQDYPSLRDEADVRRRIQEAMSARNLVINETHTETPAEAATEEVIPPAAPAPEITETPLETPPTASTAKPDLPKVSVPNETSFPDVFETSDGVKLTLVRVNKNGLALYMDQDGNEYELAAEAFQ